MRFNKGLMPIMAVVVTIAPVQAGIAQGPVYQGRGDVHYAKTELEKAAGKCKATVIGGALLGSALGGLLGGRKGLAIGAAGGLAVGTGACAIITANAKHKDQIIAAQLAAAASDNPITSSWTSDDGATVSLVATRGAEQQIDGAQLIPVKYPGSSGTMASASVPAGDKAFCRPVSSNLDGKPLPSQLICRQSDGSYAPYQGPTIASTAPTNATMCRSVRASIGTGAPTMQMVCKQPDGSYAPYSAG